MWNCLSRFSRFRFSLFHTHLMRAEYTHTHSLTRTNTHTHTYRSHVNACLKEYSVVWMYDNKTGRCRVFVCKPNRPSGCRSQSSVWIMSTAAYIRPSHKHIWMLWLSLSLWEFECSEYQPDSLYSTTHLNWTCLWVLCGFVVCWS